MARLDIKHLSFMATLRFSYSYTSTWNQVGFSRDHHCLRPCLCLGRSIGSFLSGHFARFRPVKFVFVFFSFWTWLRKAWKTSSLASLSITNAEDEGYSSCTGIVRVSWHQGHTSQYLGCTTVSLYIGTVATLMIVYRRYYRSVLVRIGGIECDHQRIGETVACKLIRAGWRDLLDRSTQAMPIGWLDCGSVTFCYPSETIERFITPLLALNDLILSTQRISDISTLFMAIIWTYVLSWKNLFGGKLLPYTWVKYIRMIVDRIKGAFT